MMLEENEGVSTPSGFRKDVDGIEIDPTTGLEDVRSAHLIAQATICRDDDVDIGPKWCGSRDIDDWLVIVERDPAWVLPRRFLWRKKSRRLTRPGPSENHD